LQWITVNRLVLGAKTQIPNKSPWLLPLNSDTSHFDELTRTIAATSTNPGRYNIIGVEKPWLNSNSAAFFAAKNRLQTSVRCYYTSLGYAEKDLATALRRVDELQINYVITLDESYQTVPPNFLNVVSLPVLRELKGSNRFKSVAFKSQNGIVIFERTPPPTRAQPQQPAAATHPHA